MALKRLIDITFEEIIRDAFAAGFRSLGGDSVRPAPRPRNTEPATSGTHQEGEALGDLATTLP